MPAALDAAADAGAVPVVPTMSLASCEWRASRAWCCASRSPNRADPAAIAAAMLCSIAAVRPDSSFMARSARL